MRKTSEMILDDGRPRRRRWRYSGALTVALGLLLAPAVYEATLLSVAQWRGMTGAVPDVHTPVLDAAGAGLRRVRDDVSAVAAPALRRFPWTPSVVVPCAVAWTVVGALLLRKR